MTDETLKDIATLDLPYRRQATLRTVTFDGGMQMLRLVLREGRRITQIDLDADSAKALGAALLENAPPQQ
ncbi:MAG TPA: hypothetical protein VLA51_11790 [Paracoccaceae bacterium]|nr:hypothetical protein [Paracoccaceae bacterium]